MKCTSVLLPQGVRAIVCTSGRRVGRRRNCSVCGAYVPVSDQRLCDWKLAPVKELGRKPVTCDTLMCPKCSFVPAPDKDLCPTHADIWKNRLENN